MGGGELRAANERGRAWTADYRLQTVGAWPATIPHLHDIVGVSTLRGLLVSVRVVLFYPMSLNVLSKVMLDRFQQLDV